MAEWDPATAYEPGASVSYNGFTYIRSFYPSSPTMGTPPNEEMGTDDNGDAIRTWYFDVPLLKTPPMRACYFRLIDESQGGTLSPYYQGMTQFQQSAYDNRYGDFSTADYFNGYTTNIDQSGVGYRSVPADKAGVGMQQIQEASGWPNINIVRNTPPLGGIQVQLDYYRNLVFVDGHWIEDPAVHDTYTFYIFVMFNHPLYFRRQITIGLDTGYGVISQSFTPTDSNFCTYPLINDYGPQTYFQPDNAAFTLSLPSISTLWVEDVTSND
jgi:hypothetical protein